MTENRAWILKEEGLQRFTAIVTRETELKLQAILAMPEEAQIELATEFFAGGVTSRLKVMLAGEAIKVPAIKYPAYWQDAFKARFFPEWLLKRFPIRWKWVMWEATVLYPKVKLPEEEQVLVAVDTVEIESKVPLADNLNFVTQLFQEVYSGPI